MPKTKVQAEAPAKAAPAPVVEKQPEAPEKQVGPMPAARASTSSALPPPNGAPPPARAADVLTSPESGPGAAGRARMTTAMQRTVGNARLGHMMGTTSPETAPAASPAPAAMPPGRDGKSETIAGAASGKPAPPAVPTPPTPERSEPAPAEAPSTPPEQVGTPAPRPTPAETEVARAPAPSTTATPSARPMPAEAAPAKTAPAKPAPERPEAAPEEAPSEAEGPSLAPPETPAAEGGAEAAAPAGPAPAPAAEAAPGAPSGAKEPAGAAAKAAAESGSAAPGAPAGAKGPAGAAAKAAAEGGAGAPGAMGAAAGVPGGAEAPGGEGPAGPPALDTSSSEGLLGSLASVPPSSFDQAVTLAKAAVPQIQKREKTDLENSFPEIERPTGLPRQSEKPKAPATQVKRGEAPASPSAGGREGGPPETRHEEAAGPVPGSQVSTSVSEPVQEEEGSWWEWLVNRVRRFLSQLPTSDSGVSTSAGPRPHVDLSGDADPAQNAEQQQASDQEVTTERADADAATMADFGENDIYPTVPKETLRPAYKPGAPPPAAGGGEAKMPAVRDDARAAFDAGAAPWLHGKIQEQIEQHRQDKAAYQQQSKQIRQEGRRKIAEETKRVRGEQTGVQQQARSDVDTQREKWREENRKIQAEYATKSQAKRLEVDKQIHEKVQTSEAKADKTLTDAEHRADQERIKAEAKAAAKKREAENKPRSWWDRVKGAVSDVFNAIKKAVNAIFDALRKLVKGIIEAAKAIVRGIIEAARLAIVGLIKGFGAVLKGFVTIALAAFPETAAKARAWIDDKVDGAVDAVNEAAEALKQATDAILDWVGERLDDALALVQKGVNAMLDVAESIVMTVIDGMAAMAKFLEMLTKFGPFLEGAKRVFEDPGMVIDGIKASLQGMIDQVPAQANVVVNKAMSIGGDWVHHLDGVWRHLQPKLIYLRDHWWETLKEMAWDLLWPWPHVWKDLKGIWKQVEDLPGRITHGEVSKAIDDILKIWQLVNSILGVLYGWFFIASVLIGAIIGAFFGGAGAIPGALAGAAFAAEVGEALVLSLVAAETAVIGKAAYDVVFGNHTAAEQEDDYEKIAGSGLTLAITGVMIIVGEIAADLAKSILSKVSDVFLPKGETPAGELPAGEVPAGELPAGETPAGELPAGEAPKVEAPETPKVEAPEAPKAEVPEAPKAETPEAPAAETPEAPKAEEPAEIPETPKTEEPTEAPKTEEPAALDEPGLRDELPGEVTPEDLEAARALCFPEGTSVSTPAGMVPIERLRPGDPVYAYDFAARTVVVSRVQDLTRGSTGSWVDVHFTSGVLRTTLNHPIWAECEEDWVAAADLASGMTLRLQDGRLTEASRIVLCPQEEIQATYNLCVEEFHSFFAGESQILVHNGNIPPAYLKRLQRSGYRNYVLREGGPTGDIYYSGMFGPGDTPQHVQYRHSQNHDRFNPGEDYFDLLPGERTYGEARLMEHQLAVENDTIIGRDPDTFRGNRQNPVNEKKLPVYEEYVEGVKSGNCG